VLETAAGSGVVPRTLAKRLGDDARYVVTDLNQAMIDHAKSKQAKDRAIEWLQTDALELPFGADEFDVVICQFGAMFFPDRPKGYSEARRVLKDDGQYIFSVWDEIEKNELADIVTQVAGDVFPDDPPRFLARTPHGYFDQGLIQRDLEKSGFTEIKIELLEQTSFAPSAFEAAKAYCQGTPLRNEIEARDLSMLEPVTEQAAAAIKARFGKGPIKSKISALVISATK
jgi:ubiquinone/menaquinone biosynthesis C-methylase UbiE